MEYLYYLKNTVQNYAWGSKDSFGKLFGTENPSGEPQAEIWMGAHPKASSIIVSDGKEISLHDFIAENRKEFLGAKLAEDKETLPFLMKAIAVAEPLSIQVHPSKADAEQGFAGENEAGKDSGSPDRNYFDSEEKTETILALTPFTALCGFRKPGDIYGLFKMTIPISLKPQIELLKKRDIRTLVEKLLTMDHSERKLVLREYTASASSRISTMNEAYPLCFDLMEYYSDDMAVLAPMLLNIVHLEPGMTMTIKAGTVHSYLEGTAIELMNCSDNTVRCGLTSKHRDIQEFLKTASFDSPSLKPCSETVSEGTASYETGADYTLMEIKPGEVHISVPADGTPSVLFCTEGEGTVSFEGKEFAFKPGTSAVIPASAPACTVSGNCRIFRAGWK